MTTPSRRNEPHALVRIVRIYLFLVLIARIPLGSDLSGDAALRIVDLGLAIALLLLLARSRPSVGRPSRTVAYSILVALGALGLAAVFALAPTKLRLLALSLSLLLWVRLPHLAEERKLDILWLALACSLTALVCAGPLQFQPIVEAWGVFAEGVSVVLSGLGSSAVSEQDKDCVGPTATLALADVRQPCFRDRLFNLTFVHTLMKHNASRVRTSSGLHRWW